MLEIAFQNCAIGTWLLLEFFSNRNHNNLIGIKVCNEANVMLWYNFLIYVATPFRRMSDLCNSKSFWNEYRWKIFQKVVFCSKRLSNEVKISLNTLCSHIFLSFSCINPVLLQNPHHSFSWGSIPCTYQYFHKIRYFFQTLLSFDVP